MAGVMEIAEGNEDDGEIPDNNLFIQNQPPDRVIEGVVKINFQRLQLTSMMLEALHCSKGDDINAPYNLLAARRFFSRKYEQYHCPSRQSFRRFV